LSKETGLVPYNPFFSKIRDIIARVYNKFSNSKMDLNSDVGFAFPKIGDFDQAIHFDFVNEILKENCDKINTITCGLRENVHDLLQVPENPLANVSLHNSSRLDSVVKNFRQFTSKGREADINHFATQDPRKPFNFDKQGFKSRRIKPKREDNSQTNDREE
jgi:hypothetical protein